MDLKNEQVRHRRFGLIGYPLSHSFSKRYFNRKFKQESVPNAQYELFAIEAIEEFPGLLKKYPDLQGLNITIPYKEQVIPYLDKLSPTAASIGAVNTIRFEADGSLTGYNTDAPGFQHSLLTWLPKDWDGAALILGTGGASKAISWTLENLGIPYKYVSRSPAADQFGYADLEKEVLEQYTLIINCTPLGTYPDIDLQPNLSYQYLGANNYLYDLVYNPEETTFMRLGSARGSHVKNGLEMLIRQAEEAWKIWNTAHL